MTILHTVTIFQVSRRSPAVHYNVDRITLVKPSAADIFTGEDDAGSARSSSVSPAPPQNPTGQMPARMQQDFFQALMQSGLAGTPPVAQLPDIDTAQNPMLQDPSADPFAQMLAQLTRQMPQEGLGPNVANAQGVAMDTARPKTKLEKIMPLIHLLSAWSLLAYFAVFKEPEVYQSKVHAQPEHVWWKRWAELGWRNSSVGLGLESVVSIARNRLIFLLTIHPKPSFLWAFITLLLVLHSMRIVTKTVCFLLLHHIHRIE